MIFAFRLTMTSEAQQLPRVRPKHEVRLSTPSGNSDTIYLSDSPVNAGVTSARFAIPPNARFPLKVSDLSLLWVSGTAADALDLLCETQGDTNENIKTDQR